MRLEWSLQGTCWGLHEACRAFRLHYVDLYARNSHRPGCCARDVPRRRAGSGAILGQQRLGQWLGRLGLTVSAGPAALYAFYAQAAAAGLGAVTAGAAGPARPL